MRQTKGLLTIQEVERVSQIDAFFIKRAMNEGLVQFEIHSNKIFFKREEIQLWLTKSPKLADRLRTIKEKKFVRKKSYVAKNSYILPFRGTWLVGGPHLAHCTRYAWDFLVVAPEEYSKCHRKMKEEDILNLKLFRNEGKNNPSDFLCYEREILAPADGVIIRASEPEQQEGENQNKQGTITIAHNNGEFSNLGHVLARSISVKKGEKVYQGQVLCLAGGKHGDGVTQVPHLHWDIWDHPHFLFAKGVPMLISKALTYKNDKFERRYGFFLNSGMLVSNV